MAKEHFFYRETEPLFKKLEVLARRSGVSRAAAFEDWLTAMVCALAAETKEDEYLAMIERHTKGEKGKRGADMMAEMFAHLVDAMSNTDSDILGDLYEGAITYGEDGQYMSPAPIAELMARMTVDSEARPTNGKPVYIADPACGTGRMLLAASDRNPYAELVGVDVDARCSKITAVNLGLRSRYGYVVCGNSLSGEMQFAYRIGHFYHEGPNGRRRGVIRDIAPEDTPVPVIASRLRSQSAGLFEQSVDAKPAHEPMAGTGLPVIMEVPRWLFRLEPTLAAMQAGEQPPTEASPAKRSPDTEPKPESPADREAQPPDKRSSEQQELF